MYSIVKIYLQVGSRYDSQVCVFGKEFQEKISTQKYFVVSQS